MENNFYLKIFNLIKQANNILLVTHNNPDGDAVASVCAMAEVLQKLGKNYSIFCQDPPPETFSFLPQVEKFETTIENFNFDLIIALDCSNLKRTNLVKEIMERKKDQLAIEIDHHLREEDYADLELRIPQAASTTEVLYYFVKANKIKVDKNLANCILTGILTDTANFLYPSTSDQTIKIASEMLKKGAHLPQIIENTWRNKSLAAMKVWGKAIANLRINKKYNLAVTILTKEDLQDGASEEDLEGMSGFLSNLHDVKIILFLRQQNDNQIRGSLRATGTGVDVLPLANILGGGGHTKAAGFSLDGKLERAGERWKIV